jgi:hypothetical protein
LEIPEAQRSFVKRLAEYLCNVRGECTLFALEQGTSKRPVIAQSQQVAIESAVVTRLDPKFTDQMPP